MEPFIKKYLPKSQQDIIGQDKALSQLIHFIENYKNQKKKALLIHGPPGVGKTSASYVIASSKQLEVVEINASDFRNKDSINQVIGGALGQQSLFFRGKIVLVDEVDGLSGNKDRGGIQALLKLIKTSVYPVILTATNPYDSKLNSLRSKSVLVEFLELDYKHITSILKRICKQENIAHQESDLQGLARRAGGDVRAAINNLQTLTQLHNDLSKESIASLDDRDKTENLPNALHKIFKTTKMEIALSGFENVKENQDEQMLWMDKNTPREYTLPQDNSRAYQSLAKADVFTSRIRRWQYYRFMVYVNALLTAGISCAKEQKYTHKIKYEPTGRILKMWWAKQKNAKKKAIAEKLAIATHTSTKRTLQDTMPYIQFMCKQSSNFRNNFVQQLDLEDDYAQWLKR